MSTIEFLLKAPDGQLLAFSDLILIGSLPDCEVVARTEGVLPRHARIEAKEGFAWISDLGSAIGTFVNENRVGQNRKLITGDVIRVGEDRWIFKGREPLRVPGSDFQTAQFFLEKSPNGPLVQIQSSMKVGRIVGNDLVLRDARYASRHHATLTLQGETLNVEDAGSSNGTFVNGHKISTRTQLHHRDRVRFDTEEYVVHGPPLHDDAQKTIFPGAPASDGTQFRASAAPPASPPAGPYPSASPVILPVEPKRASALQPAAARYVKAAISPEDADAPVRRPRAWGDIAVTCDPNATKFRPRESRKQTPHDEVVDPLTEAERKANSRGQTGSMYAPFAISADVHYALTTQDTVSIGSPFTLDVWAHLAKDADLVRDLVKQSLLDRQLILHKPHCDFAEIPAGAVLEARVLIPSLNVDQWGVIFWNDSIGHATYVLWVPPATSTGFVRGTVQLAVNEIVFGDIAFTIFLSDGTVATPTLQQPRQSINRFKSAFASYAEEDEERVSARVQGILVALPELDLYLDVTRIRREPDWNVILQRELVARDGFYLFWSQAAKNSPWVAQEWRTALAIKGIAAIHPVPLASPHDVPPPAELEEIAFKKWKLFCPTKDEKQAGIRNSDELPPGAMVGHYEITSSLSRGGFGITYVARDLRLKRDIVLKEYFPLSYASRGPDSQVRPNENSEHRELFGWGLLRFRDEGQALARFRHPNILGVMDHIEQNSTAYLVTPLEAGKTLDRWESDVGFDETALIDRILIPLLHGLSALHAQGLLHRDIKPQNIIVRDADGSPVLVDFGSSRVVTVSSSDSNSAPLTTVISAGFSPPEQHEGQQQGPFTDLYALSATLFYLVIGSAPVSATSRLVGQDFSPQDVDVIRERCSSGLANAILGGLDLDPQRRPQSAAEFRALLTATGEPRYAEHVGSESISILKAMIVGAIGAFVLACTIAVAAKFFDWSI